MKTEDYFHSQSLRPLDHQGALAGAERVIWETMTVRNGLAVSTFK